MNTEQEFWEEFKTLQQANESADPVIEYRIYYDQEGRVLLGTPVVLNRELPELPDDDYIVVSKEQYHNLGNEIVKNGELVKPPKNIQISTQLQKSATGFTVVKNNAALLLDDEDEFQDIEHYDRRSR